MSPARRDLIRRRQVVLSARPPRLNIVCTIDPQAISAPPAKPWLQRTSMLTPKVINIGSVVLATLTLVGLTAVAFSPLWTPAHTPATPPAPRAVVPYTASAL